MHRNIDVYGSCRSTEHGLVVEEIRRSVNNLHAKGCAAIKENIVRTTIIEHIHGHTP